MAYTEEFWQDVRDDYETFSMPFEKLAAKHGLSTSTISKRVKKYDWIKGGNEEIIQDKILIKKKIKEVEIKSEGKKAKSLNKIEREVDKRLEIEGLHLDNEKKLASKLGEFADNVNTHDLDNVVHFKNLTSSHKELTNKQQQQPHVVVNNQQLNQTLITDEMRGILESV